MSHFFQLTSLALIWRKLGQVLQWVRNGISRKHKPIDVQSSFAGNHSPNKLWLMIKPQYYRRFMNNMGVGFGILLLAFLFRDSAFLMGIENEGIDTLMQIRQKVIPANDNRHLS